MVNVVRCYQYFLHKLMNLYGFQERLVELDSSRTTLKFWVLSRPNPPLDRPALVLLHGFAGNGLLTWHIQALLLAKHHPLIYIPDLLFFGGSTTASPERSLNFQGDCLARGLSVLGVQKCVVVGFSYGGMVGFKMAQRHPELVAGMVVSGAVLALAQPCSSMALERLGFNCWSDFLLPDTVRDVKVLLGTGSYKSPWLPNFAYKHFLEEMYSNRQERCQLLKALVERDEDDIVLHHSHQMIHIIWGEEDQVLPIQEAYRLKQKLGSKTMLRSMKKAGHLCLLERPFLFNTHLKDLLTSLYGTTHPNAT